MNATKHCFVAMPYGRNDEERVWFAGWLKEVVKPAVEQAGYAPVVSTENNAPTFITDEIRQHLVQDEMAVFDLGGAGADDIPNPNVMYELGIRHAAGLPHVILGWQGQALPFDVSGQRVLLEDRRVFYFSGTRTRLAEASTGKFYRPMDAVERVAAIEKAATGQPADSIPVMAAELAQLRTTLDEISLVVREIKNEQSREKLQKVLARQALDEIGSPPPTRRSPALEGLRRAARNLRSERED